MLKSPPRKLLIPLAAIAAALALLLTTRPWERGPAPSEKPGAAAPSSTPWFTDIAAAAGVHFVHTNGVSGRHLYLEIMGGGVALFDYDGDGDLDLYFVNGNHIVEPPSPQITNILYRNDGDGTFSDVTAAAGVGDPSYGQGCCAADYDNDGDQDLFVSNFGPDRLYRNNGDGTFAEVTAEAGIDNSLWGQACAFADFDGDGWLDLYVQNYLDYSPRLHTVGTAYIDGRAVPDYPSPRRFKGAPDRLYHNEGNGTFTEVSRAAGIYRPGGRGMGLACADFDRDGDIDVFVSNDAMENYYFQNKGDGTFTEASMRSGLAYNYEGASESSMGADIGDFDGDGHLDLVCPALRAECCTLYRFANSTFTDVSRPTRLALATRGVTGFSPNFLDLDNDGDLDLFLSDGGVVINPGVALNSSYEQRYGIPDMLLLNDGAGHFDPAGPQAGAHFGRALIGRGSASGDIDNDGDIDLVLSNLNGPAVILRNDAPQGNWITLRLEAARANRQAIGAAIRIEAGGRTQSAIVRGGGSYLSLSDRRPHFGLGSATRIERLEITWPDGRRQSLTDLEVNRFLTIRQADR